MILNEALKMMLNALEKKSKMLNKGDARIIVNGALKKLILIYPYKIHGRSD
jgi:hypothetical protein